MPILMLSLMPMLTLEGNIGASVDCFVPILMLSLMPMLILETNLNASVDC